MLGVKKILFPVDFSKRCIGAARYVRAFASQFGAEIMLLHVAETGDHYYPEVAQPHLERALRSGNSRNGPNDLIVAGQSILVEVTFSVD